MNITEKYRGGNAIPDLEVIDFWKESLKDLTDVILTDHYSFPNNGKLFTDKFDEYIKASKLNNLIGLDEYEHRSYVHGTSQTFDSFWMRNNDSRVV